MVYVPPIVPVSYSLTQFSHKRERQIERDYHLALTAASIDEMRQIQAAQLAVAANAARANLVAHHAQLAVTRENTAELHEIRLGQQESNFYLSGILDAVNDVANKVADVRIAIEDQTEMQRAAFRTVHQDLTTIASQLLESHNTLKNIEDVLRRPYETKVSELLNHATKWLHSGMKNSGCEQKDDFEEAFRLLEEILKNPIGYQDYVTWFQIGWLRWKHYKIDIPSAEHAFYRATRLSAPSANLYHVKSLRHWAQMQYLLGKYEDAWQTIQRALAISREHDVMLDAARYAARTGRKAESIEMLDACIDLQPTTIVEMFAEEDFQ